MAESEPKREPTQDATKTRPKVTVSIAKHDQKPDPFQIKSSAAMEDGFNKHEFRDDGK